MHCSCLAAASELTDTKAKRTAEKREISPELLERLKVAIISLDRDALKSLIGETEELDWVFANKMLNLVHQFQYEKVEELIEFYGLPK